MTVTFEDDDTRFGQWKEANREGFVLNAGPSRHPPYAMLHWAGCRQVIVEGATGQRFVKVWADTADELRQWVAKHLPEAAGDVKVCETCGAVRPA